MQAHPPFAGYETDRLVSLSTGLVADDCVNCENAIEICQQATSEMTGKKFSEIKLRRNDKVKTMDAKHTTVNARGQCMAVNPALLFNRITCALNKGSEMSGFFAYELAP